MSETKCDGSVNDVMQVQAGTIKNGSLCILKGFPCQVTTTSVKNVNAKAKVLIEGTDLFTNKKYDQTYPASGIVTVPNTQVVEYEVADIDEEEFVSLVLDDGSLKSQLKVPKDQNLYTALMKMWNDKGDLQQVKFTVFKSYGQEKIISGRVIKTEQ